MTFLEGLSQPVWRAWSETLLHFLWQGTLLGMAAALAIHVLRLRTASQRYALLLTALLLMAACLPVTFAIVARADSMHRMTIATAEGTPVSVRPLPGVEISQDTNVSEAAVGLPSLPEPDLLSRWVVLAWSAGVVVLSLRILASWIGMKLLVRGRQPVSAALADAVARLSTRLGLRRVPPVFASARVIDATVVGFLKPIVLLPAAWVLELSPDMLEAVLAHELAHIRRHDLWINLLQRVVETALFYHPAVWWVSRRLRAEREMCCDELAVSVTHQRLVYVTALESVARRRAGQVKPALAVTLGDQDMALLKRIRHILGFSTATANPGWWPAAVVALALPAALWFGWTAFAPGTTAVAGEGATVVDTFKSGMSDYDADLLFVNFGELQRHREMVAAATENADDGTPAKSEVLDKEERPAPPAERGPDGPPGPSTEERPAGGRPGRMGGYGRGPGLGRGMTGMAKEGPSRGRPDDDRRPGEDVDGRPAYGRIGAPGAAPAADEERMFMRLGRRGAQRSRLEGRDDDDSEARPTPGQPAAGRMRGARAADMMGGGNRRGGRHVDDDDGDPVSEYPEVRPQDEMVRLLRDLHREVEQLRREVRELRDQKRPGPIDNRGADRRGPPSDEGLFDELRGPDALDAWGNPMRFYREDRDGNLRRADDVERGTPGVPAFVKGRMLRQRPNDAAPGAPRGEGMRPGSFPRGEASEDGPSGRGRDDHPRAGRPAGRVDAPPPEKGDDERSGGDPARGE